MDYLFYAGLELITPKDIGKKTQRLIDLTGLFCKATAHNGIVKQQVNHWPS